MNARIQKLRNESTFAKPCISIERALLEKTLDFLGE
jgi:hypothetical protein